MRSMDTTLPIRGVDAHAHVFTQALAFAGERRYTPQYDATLQDWRAVLDAQGVSHGVLVQPSFLGSDNSYLLEALMLAPERLRGVAVVDADVSQAQLQRMARLGVVGIRLNLMGKSLPDLGSEEWRPLLEQVAALGWHVELHRQIEDIPALVAALKPYGLKIVVDHFGRPHAAFGVAHPTFKALLALGGGDVWVKISGVYRLGGTDSENLAFAQAAIPLLIEHFGTERLMWGSDWPHTQFEDQVSYASQFELLAQLVPWPRQRQAILRDGAVALFGF
ncbi:MULTISPECIES: amidohydrolase [Pseudomonas]|uniref:amidohydrolase family protein n=1 Tax=Pseudomonas TaxID=286 RepID=UPI001CFB955E|nr:MULTISPECIES: amidohydrolase family protein [Pseudomonas]